MMRFRSWTFTRRDRHRLRGRPSTFLKAEALERRRLPAVVTFPDAVVSLSLALLVNAAIMILAASAFHGTGHANVTEIEDAYHLLDPIVGGSFAALLFGVALLASGQSSTFTGTPLLV